MPVLIHLPSESGNVDGEEGGDEGDHRLVGPEVVLDVICGALDAAAGALLRGFLQVPRRYEPLGDAEIGGAEVVNEVSSWGNSTLINEYPCRAESCVSSEK